tara:strand:- start:98 stop:406 length:309 start_codon:yes stop_codon:yes gene_type:complete
MQTTNELLQQLNTMQTNHIKVLEERIEVISEHRQHLNETISSQANQLEQAIKSITKQAIEIGEQGEKLDILKHTIEIDKITIRTQEDTIKIYLENLNNKSNV